ncbi:hypothetical protein K0M31_007462 [Melipona bicolor]|uniref:Uncharacterized protein n=1 Tax=Melipona bicolor TaxID=60889 RepID=A0AA40GBG7_9HYME|nr:hypothetical protein K0M31_007462 [Melipona bicolor]
MRTKEETRKMQRKKKKKKKKYSPLIGIRGRAELAQHGVQIGRQGIKQLKEKQKGLGSSRHTSFRSGTSIVFYSLMNTQPVFRCENEARYIFNENSNSSAKARSNELKMFGESYERVKRK